MPLAILRLVSLDVYNANLIGPKNLAVCNVHTPRGLRHQVRASAIQDVLKCNKHLSALIVLHVASDFLKPCLSEG